jgi:prevent-host-death family protein
MEDQYTIAEAKNRLPSIVHCVEKGPSVKLTRRGRPVAVLISIEEYERLHRQKGNLWASLQLVRKNIENQDVEIFDMDFDDIREKAPGREFGFT